MKTEKQVEKYQLIDHGIDGAQYFQGCGTSFTEYKDCFTGCGSNFAEALNDALDQMAMEGSYNTESLETLINEDEGYASSKDWPTVPNTDKYHEENEESEMYYYVSLRVA